MTSFATHPRSKDLVDKTYNRYDWKKELSKYIQKYDSPKMLMIAKSDIYKNHIDDKLRSYLITL